MLLEMTKTMDYSRLEAIVIQPLLRHYEEALPKYELKKIVLCQKRSRALPGGIEETDQATDISVAINV